MRSSLILGIDPETRSHIHSQIMVLLAGSVAGLFARGLEGGFECPDNSTDYGTALDYAMTASGSQQEGFALVAWLKHRTENVVTGFYFRKLQDLLVPELLKYDKLSEAEIIDIVRPLAAVVLDISPKTRRGRRRLRVARIRSRFRRALWRLHLRR